MIAICKVGEFRSKPFTTEALRSTEKSKDESLINRAFTHPFLSQCSLSGLWVSVVNLLVPSARSAHVFKPLPRIGDRRHTLRIHIPRLALRDELLVPE